MAKKKIDAKEYIGAMNATAERLSEVRKALNTREEEFKKLTDALYAEERSLKEELIIALRHVGLSSVKTSAGENYSITKGYSFIVKNELQFDAWAREQRIVRVDKTLANQRFRKLVKEGALPEFVEAEERDTISIRSPKKDDMTEESG